MSRDTALLILLLAGEVLVPLVLAFLLPRRGRGVVLLVAAVAIFAWDTHEAYHSGLVETAVIGTGARRTFSSVRRSR